MPKLIDAADLLSTLTLHVSNQTEITWYLKTGGLYDGKIWSRAETTLHDANGRFSIQVPPSNNVGPVRIRFQDGRTAQVHVPQGVHSFSALSEQGNVKWV